ncbi:MAG TPA: hypothetical protein VNG71_11555, partial [Pyrinomonadaceae bacterium]|nr:hypothetical protein [Pyrinomonadaceae bacterium]
LLRKGVGEETLHAPFTSFKKDPHKKDLIKKLALEDANAQELEYRFAVLTTLKSNYRVPANQPLLLPGSLLKEIKEPEAGQTLFLLCIQPICDCLRIDETRAFPFLQLRPPTEAEPAFDLVVPDSAIYRRLRIQYSPYTLKMIDFDPSEAVRVIQAKVNEELLQFEASSGALYRWIGELKFDQTQSIVNNYAGQLSRVGVDESEWLRRWAKR